LFEAVPDAAGVKPVNGPASNDQTHAENDRDRHPRSQHPRRGDEPSTSGHPRGCREYSYGNGHTGEQARESGRAAERTCHDVERLVE
jgi:hypothetical protein